MGNSLDHLVNVLHLLGFLVVNLDVKLTFEIEKDIEAIERVDPQGFKATVRMHAL
jgi:hypothetical protein